MTCSGHSRWSLLQIAAALLAVLASAALALGIPGRIQAQPEPTIELLPPSGPCDAPVQVTGRGFPVPSGPFQDQVWLYLVQPGTADVHAGSLSRASVDPDGSFSQWVGLRQGGCEAAALDSETEQPSGHLVIAATLSEASLRPGDRIPDIIATAQYTYTTTVPHVPTETLQILPATGPCDGTVEVTGSGFEPGLEVVLQLASVSGEFGLGPLASAVTGADGRLAARFSFGELGCGTAGLIAQYSSGRELVVGAFPAVHPTPTPPGPPHPLAAVRYSFATTTPAAGHPPRKLPATGGGPGPSSGLSGWVAFAGNLGGLGVVLVIASLYLGRKRT